VLPDERPTLRGFVARLIGFAPERTQAVEHALHATELAATYQTALVLCGDGDLVPVARGVHRHALGDERPFVLCDPRQRAPASLRMWIGRRKLPSMVHDHEAPVQEIAAP